MLRLISKFSLALHPEALVNTSGRVLFSSPGIYVYSTNIVGELFQLTNRHVSVSFFLNEIKNKCSPV